MRRAWEKAGVNEKWAQSSWAKKIEARQKVNNDLVTEQASESVECERMYRFC